MALGNHSSCVEGLKAAVKSLEVVPVGRCESIVFWLPLCVSGWYVVLSELDEALLGVQRTRKGDKHAVPSRGVVLKGLEVVEVVLLAKGRNYDEELEVRRVLKINASRWISCFIGLSEAARCRQPSNIRRPLTSAN